MTGWLVDTLLATSALLLLVLILRQPVREHFGSRVAYALWLLPAARVLMPTLTETVTRTVSAPEPILPASAPLLTSASIEPQLLGAVTPVERTLIDALGGWPTILMTIWLGIAAGLLLRGLFEYRAQRADILKGSVQLARIGSIRLVRTSAVAGPLAFGLIDRVIAVPADFERRFDERERCLALDHELAHHRHLDLYTNSFAFVLLSLQWFNPLAWWSYAAFRFDQEAACDARVLDKAMPNDRADYGRAIAKAASGRALLLASALDHKKTLHRRLKSMLNNTPKSRRLAATGVVVIAAAIALPLTATRAIEYVDVLAPEAPVAPVAPVAPAAAAAAVVAPDVPDTPEAPDHSFDVRDGKIMIDGKEKRWSDLTPQEKAEIRANIAEARRELAEVRIDRGEIQREIQQAMAEARVDKEDMRKEMAEARREIEQAMREIDANADHIRKSGQDPEAIKASVLAALKSVEAIDIEKITRDAMASVNQEALESSLKAAEASVRASQAELDRIEQNLKDD